MIENAEGAERLARALCADIRLYQQSAVRDAAPSDRARILEGPVAEAYGLFTARVSPTFQRVFEEAVIALYAELGAPDRGMPTAATATTLGPVGAHPPVRGEGSPSIVFVMLLAFAFVAMAMGGAVAFFGR